MRGELELQLGVCPILTPPHTIYRRELWVNGEELQPSLAKPLSGANEGVTRQIKGKVSGAHGSLANRAGRPTPCGLQRPPFSSGWLSCGPSCLIHVSCRCPKSVTAESGPFEPCEPKFCTLIGQRISTSDQ